MSSGSLSLSFQSCLASVRAAGDKTGLGVGVLVRGTFLISFWCAAGLNGNVEAVLVDQYADGATVCLGVSVDVACWGLPAGSADLMSLSLSVGTILPSVTGDSVSLFSTLVLSVTPSDVVLIHTSSVYSSVCRRLH